MARLTWRRQADERGLARVCQSERGFELRYSGMTVGQVSKTSGGYYFYGCGKNSLWEKLKFETYDLAKVACKKWVLSSDEFKEIKVKGEGDEETNQ